ncbi:hypothetical protein [Serratia ficaria]|uniref:Uncharacterized protein n=1 Tax=Serratia ficaria TaxID=61651 RepID=A0A240BNV7_SERFI|nr:hypothetical protein [Serratia ficaria]REF45817.1 hypothetical protein C7332_4165 [Serratia ficaria]CAI0845416.1 Uncharacterised protein [Serratia ficaria]CAI0936706.1 Uncharacterised protein [Serratia ficaria]CAI0987021.1 Uncharacterised protein [Serratia ficaria]CAI2035698.1 Uncharacterised protein [Serratia ficaria]
MKGSKEIVDGIVFKDEDDPRETVIFNFHTWVEMLKGIIIKYAHKSEDEAESLVLSSSLVCKPIRNYMAVCLRSHELEYHWAMLIAYGEQYWLKDIERKQPAGYLEWEAQYSKANKLAEESFVFSD